MKIHALLLAVALAGCATTEKFEANLNSFLGRGEVALISQWGPPQSSYTLGDGSRVLQYTRSGQFVMPGSSTTTTYGNSSHTTFAPPIAIAQNCSVNWTIDRDGVIQNWSANGNHCKSR